MKELLGMKTLKYVVVILSVTWMVACGSGNGDPLTSKVVTDLLANLALEADVSADYDEASAAYVVDEDTSTSFFWSGNAPGDSLTIDLGSIRNLTKIVVHTNETSVSTVNPKISYELSQNGSTWDSTMNIVGVDVLCTTAFTVGSGQISCDLRPSAVGDAVSNSVQYRYFRTTVNSADVGLIRIYEIEITGWTTD